MSTLHECIKAAGFGRMWNKVEIRNARALDINSMMKVWLYVLNGKSDRWVYLNKKTANLKKSF